MASAGRSGTLPSGAGVPVSGQRALAAVVVVARLVELAGGVALEGPHAASNRALPSAAPTRLARLMRCTVDSRWVRRTGPVSHLRRTRSRIVLARACRRDTGARCQFLG